MLSRIACGSAVAGAVLMAFGMGSVARAEWVADFEELTPRQAYAGVGGGFYENGLNLAGSFTSGGLVFDNYYDDTWQFWSGWAYSNTTDRQTAGYGNQYSAFAPAPIAGGTNYAIGYSSATVNLPSAPVGAYITNTTYAALSMLEGDSFAKKFGGASGLDPDWFLLTIVGRDAGGAVTDEIPFFLANYTAADSADDYIVQDWTWVDLSGLPNTTRQLEFILDVQRHRKCGACIHLPTLR